MHRRSATASLTLAIAVLVSRSALAGSFTDDGTFVLDPQADFTQGFEEPDEGDTDGGADASVTPIAADPAALEGTHVLSLMPFQGVDLPVTLPAERRTYRVGVWIRGGETIADLEISYTDRPNEIAALFPTGRITSDGWVELANDHVRVDGPRLTKVTLGLFSPSGGMADAVELAGDGELPLATPNAPCAGAVDAAASCAPDQVCLWSECRNVLGWVPPIPPDREAVTDYLEARMTLLFGPFAERTVDLPQSLVAVEQMRQAKDRWSYWNGFMLAVRRLHDGHTTTSGLADFVLKNPKPLALCFLEGDADLSHAVAPKDPEYLDVLVSHTGGDHNLGLHAGDRLVSVDGHHPIEWARTLVAFNWSQEAISNHVTYAELASSLRGLISRYADHIEVIRCDAAAGTCGAVETVSIHDLPWDPDGTPIDSVTCDNRPLRHLPTSPPKHDYADTVFSGIVVESDATEKIYGLEWESLFVTSNGDTLGKALSDQVKAWKADARGVILDHRTGFGGTGLGDEILWSFAVPRYPSNFYEDRQHAEDEQPTLAEGAAKFEQALAAGFVQYAGSNSAVLDVPVALLLTQDVSASDWLPMAMKGTSPKIRLFGPFQTNGAFSTRYGFGYWLGMSYVAAVGDTFLADGRTLNGTGIEPDEVVLPKQSDLVAGKDSVYEAALAWVRQELKP